MTRRTEILDDDLHAFIDGELDDAAREGVEAAIAVDPALAETVELFRADKERVAAVYGSDLNEVLPRRWIAMIENGSRNQQWRDAANSIVAIAATVMLVFGLTLAFRQSAVIASDDIVADALAARANEVAPRTMIAVSSAAEAQVQNVALAKALATRVKVPDLARLGYRLVGIESYDSPVRSFELMYRDRQAHVFTLYVRHSPGGTRFDQFADKGLRVCVWQDDAVATVMSGQMSVAEMQRLASLTYVELTL